MKCPKCESMKPEGGAEESDSHKPMQRMIGMCADMLGAMRKTAEMAAFATPEVHRLVEEWLAKLEARAITILREHGEMATITLATSRWIISMDVLF